MPSLTQPPNLPCTEATSPSGAEVVFAKPTATDLADANVLVTCVPASGSTFPLGTTTVTCTGVDVSGNVSPSVTFTVKVCALSALHALHSFFVPLTHRLSNALIPLSGV